MPFIFLYIAKLSVCLAMVYLFYRLVLQRLTFYNWNRYYLLLYTFISFYIPLIDVSHVLAKSNLQSARLVQLVPAMGGFTEAGTGHAVTDLFTINNIALLLLLTGTLVAAARLCLQFFSLNRLRKKAQVIYVDDMKLYQVDSDIVPFSFGKSIFISRQLHSQAELQDIVLHEFIHVKQQHSIDIVCAEIICVLNWFNPFAWLIKKAIRQNLEFIADEQVLKNGISKKDYQYLLLKVTGNTQFSIAAPFNFSSLKKRIAMMNKMKSAKLHLIKFLFLVPLVAVVLLAFRNKLKEPAPAAIKKEDKVSIAGLVVDAATRQPLADVRLYCKEKNVEATTDANGYYLLQLPFGNEELRFTLQVTKPGYRALHQTEHWGNFTSEQIFTRYGHSFEFFGLGKNGKSFSALGGNAADIQGLNYEQAKKFFEKVNGDGGVDDAIKIDTIPGKSKDQRWETIGDIPNEKGYLVDINGRRNDIVVVVKDKNRKLVKRIPLSDWNAKEEYYENLYGALPLPPPPPPPPGAPIPPVPPAHPIPDNDMVMAPAAPVPANAHTVPPAPLPPLAPAAPLPPLPPAPPKLPENVKRLHVNNEHATVTLKDGTIEKYDLTVPAEKEKFDSKYRPGTPDNE